VTKPYGTWESPLTAAAVAEGGFRLSAVAVDGDDIYWLEGRPAEGGRYVLVRRSAEGSISDVTPAGMNVRTRVHEYGGGAYTVAHGIVYFVNFADQRIYRDNTPMTPEGPWRYADLQVDRRRNRLIAVREDHSAGGEPVNALVSIPLGGTGSSGDILASGYDFYSTPRLSRDGSMLSWLAWRHPNMPWDATELWVADVSAPGALVNVTRLSGPDDSVYQPGWGPEGTVYYASDATGWWNLLFLKRSNGGWEGSLAASLPRAEFGRPEWVFGTATWAFAGDQMVATYTRHGRWHLALVDPDPPGAIVDLVPGLEPHDWLVATKTHAVLVAGFATRPDAVVRVNLESGAVEILREASANVLDEADVSVAQPIEFPTADSQVAHAFYYPPCNSRFRAPEDEAPPLIVISHGGPTAAASATLNLNIQYWTTRGFAVVDVNYGGSSGFGREYRERLNGQWGIVDVNDVISAARYLALRGKADLARLAIRGGSAGGYTTLAALTFHPDAFQAGASYYGISDLEVLEVDTHKFESRYSHSLIGPYPEAKDTYYQRSPIHFVDRLSCPLILFQGLEDKVVPPNQSQMMADAVRAKGLPVVYLAFEGEQHGFRKAETIIRCLEAELQFYREVFGIAG
jgi:dipeptidyl aminopeptidase/acylaminoacyl peptidase